MDLHAKQHVVNILQVAQGRHGRHRNNRKQAKSDERARRWKLRHHAGSQDGNPTCEPEAPRAHVPVCLTRDISPPYDSLT